MAFDIRKRAAEEVFRKARPEVSWPSPVTQAASAAMAAARRAALIALPAGGAGQGYAR